MPVSEPALTDGADMITAAHRREYRDHGVVALRGVLPATVVDALAVPVGRALGDPGAMADMSAMSDALAATSPIPAATDRGRFRSGVDHWRDDPDMGTFALRSPLPALIASLLQTETLHLYEDSILVKEPGAVEPTMFHQDHSYFSVEGDLVCTTWVPLDPVTRETGAIGYVRGSHLDSTVWRPNLFVTSDGIPGSAGDDVPDFHADEGDADIVWIDAVPGDVIVHHARTLHGAGPNMSTSVFRRAVSVRYCGAGTIYRERALTPKPHHAEMNDGEPLRPPAFPIAWTADEREKEFE